MVSSSSQNCRKTGCIKPRKIIHMYYKRISKIFETYPTMRFKEHPSICNLSHIVGTWGRRARNTVECLDPHGARRPTHKHNMECFRKCAHSEYFKRMEVTQYLEDDLRISMCTICTVYSHSFVPDREHRVASAAGVLVFPPCESFSAWKVQLQMKRYLHLISWFE
jgi:hypothetical protein